jgi:phage terminase large subunit-like protein
LSQILTRRGIVDPARVSPEARQVLAALASLPPDVRDKLQAQLRSNIDRHDAHHRFEKMYPDRGPLRRELYGRHLAFFAASEKHVETALIGGNRVGKSASAAYALTAHLTGRYPHWWQGRRFDRPIASWASGTDTKSVRETVQTALFGQEGKLGTGMIPLDSIEMTTRRAGVSGAIDSATIRNVFGGSSRVVLKSYDQRREAFQGAKCDVIWLDEESERDIYSECLARLTATVPGERSGLLMCTFTPLRGISEVVLGFLPGGRPKQQEVRF